MCFKLFLKSLAESGLLSEKKLGKYQRLIVIFVTLNCITDINISSKEYSAWFTFYDDYSLVRYKHPFKVHFSLSILFPSKNYTE